MKMDQYRSLTNDVKDYGSIMHPARLDCWLSTFIANLKRKLDDGKKKEEIKTVFMRNNHLQQLSSATENCLTEILKNGANLVHCLPGNNSAGSRRNEFGIYRNATDLIDVLSNKSRLCTVAFQYPLNTHIDIDLTSKFFHSHICG